MGRTDFFGVVEAEGHGLCWGLNGEAEAVSRRRAQCVIRPEKSHFRMKNFRPRFLYLSASGTVDDHMRSSPIVVRSRISTNHAFTIREYKAESPTPTIYIKIP